MYRRNSFPWFKPHIQWSYVWLSSLKIYNFILRAAWYHFVFSQILWSKTKAWEFLQQVCCWWKIRLHGHPTIRSSRTFHKDSNMSSSSAIRLSCSLHIGKPNTNNTQLMPITPARCWKKARFDLEKHTVSPKSFHYFKYMHELWGLVRENIDPNPIVINSQDLLDGPEESAVPFLRADGFAIQGFAVALGSIDWRREKLESRWGHVGATYDDVLPQSNNQLGVHALEGTGTSGSTDRRCDSASWSFISIL